MVNKLAGRRDIVLVTGGCGFLGKHLIGLLTKCEGITEIRIVDIQPRPDNFPAVENGPKINFVTADIRNYEDLVEACRGVDYVIHTAAAIETGNNPDVERLTSVNIQGTTNVIEACVECNVQYLIYTGTSEICRSYQSMENADEEYIDALKENSSTLVLNGYSSTKREAEVSLLTANGRELKDSGKTLHTVSLRPCAIYGEGDYKYVSTFLRTGKRLLSIMPRLGPSSAKIQRVYVGNVAWAHICALDGIREGRAEEVCGRSYLVTDNTPVTDNFGWMKPFMEAHRIKVLSISVPLLFLYYLWYMIELLAIVVSPLFSIDLPFASGELFLACSTCTYNGARAKKYLNYKPLFSDSEAFSRSYEYYANLDLTKEA